MKPISLFLLLTIFAWACSETRQDSSFLSDADLDLDELLRPQYHYTADSGFLSDPSGLVYYQGDFHLFHQYSPITIRWGVPQHWAHAVSKDLVNWERLPIAIYPHGGGNIYSGSAVVDRLNTSGLQTGEDPPIVAFYTWNKDFSQWMTYSNDGAKTWTEFEGNPVVPHIYGNNRDPKVFWHEASGRWVMILFVEKFDIFTSENLKEWTRVGSMELDKFHECPDFLELPVDGNANETRSLVTDVTGRYYIGAFDGLTFTIESGWHLSDWNDRAKSGKHGYGEFYSTQTWSNMPSNDGRTIQIAAMRDRKYRIPTEKFHNQMTFPCELTLRTTDEGIRLFRWPVGEIESLYKGEQSWENQHLEAGQRVKLADGDLLDIEATLKLPPSTHEATLFRRPWAPLSFRFTIRGVQVHYDAGKQELAVEGVTAPLKVNEKGELDIRILVDKISLEIFGNGGLISISTYANFGRDDHSTYLSPTGGAMIIKELTVRELKPGLESLVNLQ